MAGEGFGPYRIEGLLGRGSMGEVHRATDLRKDRVVALKLLSAAHSGDEGFATRFRREAEMTARLNDPHVIPIHDYGEIDGRLYLDMRLVEGADLGTVLATAGSLDPVRAVAIVEQVAAALDAAHRAELIHRDVKPSNILLTRPEGSERGAQLPEFAYLIDFGIAASLNDSRLTSQSTLIGTAAYMAPERFRPGAGGDHRVDVYALGCVLHEAVTGGAPFPTKSIHQLVHAHLHQPPPRPGALRAGVPPALDAVVATAMDKEPDRRYRHAGELAVAARAAVSGTASWPAARATGAWPAPGAAPSATSAPTAPTGPTGPVGTAGTSPHDASSLSLASTDEWGRPASSPAPSPAGPVAAPRSRRRRPLLVVALLLVVLGLLALGGTLYLRSPGQGAPTAAALPEGLVGSWNGTQTEPVSGRSFPIRIDLSPGAVGEEVGQMSFSVFDCRFALFLAGTAPTVDLQARPVAGPCSEGLVRATVEGPDRFSYETRAGDQVVARGDLARG
ncbi:MAG TPA: protein kinase [Actinomycetospora sp.]|nr:protein kinase [Actinomycetospora sp.]